MKMMKRDWPVFLGAIAGSCIGMLAVGYWAAYHFKLYTFRNLSGVTYPGTATYESIRNLPRTYDSGAIALWMVAGFIVGAYLGILAVALLRAVNRPSN